MVSDNSSTEYKTVPAIKKEIEIVNFNQYQNWKEQKHIDEIKPIP